MFYIASLMSHHVYINHLRREHALQKAGRRLWSYGSLREQKLFGFSEVNYTSLNATLVCRDGTRSEKQLTKQYSKKSSVLNLL